MSLRVLAGLLWGLLALGLTAPAGATPRIDVDILSPVTRVQRDVDERRVTVELGRGSVHGLRVGAQVRLYEATRPLVGRVTRVRVRRATAVFDEPAAELKTDSLVVATAQLVATHERGLGRAIFIHAIDFTDNRKRSFISIGPARAGAIDSKRLLTSTNTRVDKLIIRAMRDVIRSRRTLTRLAATLEASPLPTMTRGKWRGVNYVEACRNATDEDIESFLHYVVALPGRYQGKSLYVAESFVAWLASGPQLAADDGLAELAAANDARFGALIAELPKNELLAMLDHLPSAQQLADTRVAVLSRISAHPRANTDVAIAYGVAVAEARNTPSGRPLGAALAWGRAARLASDAGHFARSIDARAEQVAAALEGNQPDLADSVAGLMAGEIELRQLRHPDRPIARANEVHSLVSARILAARGHWTRVVDRLTNSPRAPAEGAADMHRHRQLDMLLANALARTGRITEAEALYQRAEQDALARRNHAGAAELVLSYARRLIGAGRYRPALAQLTRAIADFERLDKPADASSARLEAAEAAWATGDRPLALALVEKARELPATSDPKILLARSRAWRAGVSYLREMGRWTESAEALTQATQIAGDHATLADTAGVTFELALLQVVAGDAARALTLLDRAATTYGSAGLGDQAIAVGLKALEIVAANGKPSDVQKRLATLKALAELGGDRGSVVRIAVKEAELARRAHSYEHARSVLEKAAKGLTTRDLHLARLHVARARFALFGDGRAEQALTHVSEALAINEQLGDNKLDVEARQVRARAKVALGSHSAAIVDYTAVIKRLEQSGREPDLADALVSTAIAHVELGRIAAARSLAARALALTEKLRLGRLTGWALDAMARVERAYGDWHAELELLDRAVAAADADGDRFARGALRFNRASVALRLRDPERALLEVDAAERIAKDVLNEEFRLSLMEARALGLQLLGRDAAAEAAFRAALARANTTLVGRSPALRRRLAQLLSERGETAQAIQLVEGDAQQEATESGHQHAAQGQLGVLLAKAGRDQQAKRWLDTALKHARAAGGALPWEALYQRAMVALRDGQRAEARGWLREASDELFRSDGLHVDDDARARFLSGKHEVFQQLMTLLLEDGEVREAFLALDRARLAERAEMRRRAGALTASEKRQRELEVQAGRLQQLFDQQLAAPKPDDAVLTRLDEELRTTRTELARFVEQVDRQGGFDAYAIRPVQLTALQEGLADGVLLLSPIVLDDRIVVFAVTRDVFTHFDVVVPRSEVETVVRTIVAEMDTGQLTRFRPLTAAVTGGSATRVEASLKRVLPALQRGYDLIMRQALERLGEPKHLIVSAAGLLRYLPWAALHDGTRYAIERFSLNRATSMNTLSASRRTLRRARNTKVLVVADPDGTLPGALTEAERIVDHVPRARTLLGSAATRLAMTKALRRRPVDVLHIASHGRIDASAPERSHLVFADGPLTYSQIPALDLGKTAVVVLSACDTAARVRGNGAEVAGLAYQFLRTKAQRVVATLWKVDDAATSALFNGFYRQLATGADVSSALATAQRQMLKAEDATRRHPAFWAPLTTIGGR